MEVYNGLDLIYQKYHTRVCLPGLNNSSNSFFKHWGKFYKCRLTPQEFKNQKDIFTREAHRLFEGLYNDTLSDSRKAHLHRKIRLCNIGLIEDWHSPVFATKINGHLILTTGHNKLYATSLRKKNYNMDFDLFVLDLDDDIGNKFIDILEIENEDMFEKEIGSDDFVFDVSFESGFVDGFIPCVMQFAKHKPIDYHDGTYELASSHLEFFNKYSVDNKIQINIKDTFMSSIKDNSGFFDITEDNCKLVFTTNRQINFDLADLLPYLEDKVSKYESIDKSYTLKTEINNQTVKLSCPSL